MSQLSDDLRVPPTACPTLPLSAGLIGLFGILGEMALMADEGLRLDNPGTPISMTLTALVVMWASYGVLAGRTGRLVLVAVVLGLSVLGYAWDVFGGPGGYEWPLLHLLLTLAMTGALVALVRSPFHRWQRTHHDLTGAPIVGVMLLAAVCGVLGPLGNTPAAPVQVSINL